MRKPENKEKRRIRTAIYRKENPLICLFSHYKCNAKSKGIEFHLTKNDFRKFWQLPCHYCGISIETIGLDRVDNERGYFIDNVVPCCRTCNFMKKNHQESFFIEHCKRIANRF